MSYEEQQADIAGEGDYEEAPKKEFAPTHDFREDDTLVGTYVSQRTVTTKNGDRTVHTFTVDGKPVDAFGTSMLNSRLDGLIGMDVKVLSTGNLLDTKAGRKVREFKVFVRKGALPKLPKQ